MSGWTRHAASPAAVIVARFEAPELGGANHLRWILEQPAAARIARVRALGMWDANEGETCSAYERLADLIDAGEITAANLTR